METNFNSSKEVFKKEVKAGLNNYEIEKGSVSHLYTKIQRMVTKAGGPEKFFLSLDNEYEPENVLREVLVDVSKLALEALEKGEFSEVVEMGRQALEVSGIVAARHVSTQSPDGVIAVAEAINWAAKSISYTFYILKSIIIVAASQVDGVSFGRGKDGAYYLSTPTIGVASFHDPGDEVGSMFTKYLGKEIPLWEHKWSGVPRQHDAFNLLEDLNSRRGLVEAYAEVTSPVEIKNARDTYMKQNLHDRLIAIGEILK